jgi:hypothetical protein
MLVVICTRNSARVRAGCGAHFARHDRRQRAGTCRAFAALMMSSRDMAERTTRTGQPADAAELPRA